MRRIAGVLAALLATPAAAIEVARTASTAERGSISLEVGGQLFLQVEGDKGAAADWSRQYEIRRAQLNLTLRYDDLLRLEVEPDFGGGAVGLRDAFLELKVGKSFDLKLGRVKSPHGWLDNLSVFDLPALSRGLVTDIFRDRLGFGGRQIAVLPRLRLRELPLKPWVVAGVFGDLSTDLGVDAAAALGIKPAKGLDVSVSWHHRAGARVDGSHGNAVSLTVAYDRKFLFAALEGTLAQASLLRLDGGASIEDASLWGAHVLVSVPIEVHEQVTVAPFVGGSIVDPELGSGGDLGFEIEGGVQARWLDMVMVGLEIASRLGQDRFVIADRTQLTAFIGASL